jgi:hypothetical protein
MAALTVRSIPLMVMALGAPSTNHELNSVPPNFE